MISILNFTFGSSVTVEEYNALRAAVGWRILSTRQARCTVENSAFLVTALHEGKVVGMARAITDGGYVSGFHLPQSLILSIISTPL